MNTPTFPKVCYTLDHLAAETGISVRTWTRRIRSGELPAVRLGRRVLVTGEALTRFLAAHEDGTGAPARPAPEWMASPERRAAAAQKRRSTLAAEALA